MPSTTRPRGQRWLSFHREPPGRFPTRIHVDHFNFSVSYSSVTDVTIPYGETRSLQRNESKTLEPKYAQRRKPVLWLVSNCDTSSKRETYARQLQRYIDVDVMGDCSPQNVILRQQNSCGKRQKRSCERQLAGRYFFYLAFENTVCKDYVTEKAWTWLRKGVVPVVLGGADYANQLPAHSYIDVRDFRSPRHLADYLLSVMSSEQLYSSYHAWRHTQTVVPPLMSRLCSICKFAYDTLGDVQIIQDVNKMWSADKYCSKPQDYYKGIFDFKIEHSIVERI